jgi:hypothetical protein
MSRRDRRLAAEKYAGQPSASETSRAKEAKRGRPSAPAAGSVQQALANFDPSNPKETAIPRDEESKSRARSHRLGLPRLP